MRAYLDLLQRVLDNGDTRMTRAGSAVTVFGESMKFDMRGQRFPLVTTRRVPYKAVFGELAAFLTGSTLLETFHDFGCHYWDGNAESWTSGGPGRVGRIYGYQWRHWNGQHDQIEALIHGIRDDPGSRRHILTCWNPSDLHDMCLPPCHLLTQFDVHGDWLDCLVYMRSVDVCLGLPADLALYGALLILIAAQTGRKPCMLTFMLGNTHVYTNHVLQAQDQLKLTPFPAPAWSYAWAMLGEFKPDSIRIDGYLPHPSIHYALNL